jgi:pimeloyl-ACP methyl ester carboxylesterase
VRLTTLIGAVVTVLVTVQPAAARVDDTRETIAVRGRSQVLHLYGARGGVPVVVSSGDGGWVHLGPHVAEVLAAAGYFVVGFDVRAYLEAFSGASTLRQEEVARDYGVLVDFAAKGGRDKPLLIGVSEGAGLSVLAATDPPLKLRIAGVIGLGLPDRNELAWRWKDSIIYFTHTAPHEPSFSTAAIVDRVSPLPLAAIHSMHDEYVPPMEVRQVFDHAAEPKRLWLIDAANHRFSDRMAEFDRRLMEAVEWVSAHAPGT